MSTGAWDKTSVKEPPSTGNMHASTTSSSETSLVQTNRPKTVYFHGGIGGAGNYRKVIPGDITEPAANPNTHQPRPSHLPRSIQGFFSSGIGGAGNMHTRAEEAALSAEEELMRAKILEEHFAKRWFVGIGGKGNRRDLRPEHSPKSHLSNTITSSHQTSHLGAAEALKRKLLGSRSRR